MHSGVPPSMSSSQERDVAETHLPGGQRRETAVDVIGGGEDDRDEVVVVDPVAIQHLGQEHLDPLHEVVPLIDLEGRRATQAQHRGHG